MSDDRVRIEVENHVADVRLVRADKHNALDLAMFEALAGASEELRGRRDVRAVVLRGDGPSFCSGLDFPSVAAGGEEVRQRIMGRAEGEPSHLAQRAAVGWLELPVPVVAALHGNVLGGGFQVALGADIRYAAPDTRMCVMEGVYGLIPDMGITRTLPGLVSLDVAKELTWTARVVEAEEALELGLVRAVENDPVARAHALAAEIAARSPEAIRAGKRLLAEAWAPLREDLLALEADLQAQLSGTPNQIAAVQAAMAKQPAEFADPVD